MRYFYADRNWQTFGPVNADEVLAMYRDGALDGTSPLIAEGASTWGTVDTLLGPSRALSTSHPPPPLPISACATCGTPIPPGRRWCPNCHASAIPGVLATLATPARRLGAYVLDAFMPTVVLLAAVPFANRTDNGVLFAILFVCYLIWALSLFARGTTPGKNLLGLDVITESGRPAGLLRMIGREWLGKFISSFLFCLGYIWILIDPDRQAWHDKLFSTYVVRRPEGY